MIGLVLDNTDYQKIDNGEITHGGKDPEKRQEAAQACYIAAGLYAFFLLISVVRYVFIRRSSGKAPRDVYRADSMW